MELHSISSCGSGDGPPLLHWAAPVALLPRELPQVREEGVLFPGSRPRGGRLPEHCSEEEALLAPRTLVAVPDVGSHPEWWQLPHWEKIQKDGQPPWGSEAPLVYQTAEIQPYGNW